jgi:hypothetical protein
LLLISAGTVKTPLLPLLEVIKPCCCYWGAVVLNSDCGEGELLTGWFIDWA